MSYVPYAIAAADGSVNGHSARALVAAGVTLLQRCAPLVRALADSAPASLLLPSAAFVTALGASEGHALLVLDPRDALYRLKETLATHETRVVFTLAEFAAQVPVETICVLLDRVPQIAVVRLSAADIRDVDLGSHVGLAIEGESEVPGSNETVLEWYEHGEIQRASHHEVMSGSTGGWAGELIRHLIATPTHGQAPSEKD